MHRFNSITWLIILVSALSVSGNSSILCAQDIASISVLAVQPELAADSVAVADARAAASFWKTVALTAGIVLVTVIGLLISRARRRISKINDRLLTEQENNKENLRLRERLGHRIAHLERVESLGDLANGIAHDFNNLLMGVIANAEAMRARPEDGEQHRQCLDAILQSAEVAAELSQTLLGYAGKRTTQPVATDLNQLIEELLPLVKSTNGFQNNLEMKFESLTDNAYAKIDVAQIKQVLLNLVRNAIEAINSGNHDGHGVISISTGRESIANPESNDDLFGTRTNGGDFVYFEVADTGDGISTGNISRIFEPFFSGTENGRGLGLAVVLGNVNRHDGLIRCRTDGNRTLFRILLPETQPAEGV